MGFHYEALDKVVSQTRDQKSNFFFKGVVREKALNGASWSRLIESQNHCVRGGMAVIMVVNELKLDVA